MQLDIKQTSLNFQVFNFKIVDARGKKPKKFIIGFLMEEGKGRKKCVRA